MIITLILGMFAVLCAYISKFDNYRWALAISFTLVYLFLAFRYDYGNDYQGYLRMFQGISSYRSFDIEALQRQYYEPGWIFLNWVFKYLGFFAMNAVLAIFNCLIYYRFITKYVPVQYYWLAIFLYIFTPSFMLLHSSAMRQSVAIMLFVLSLNFIISKKAIRYFITIGFASLFHFSALILFPIYFIVFLNYKIRILLGNILIALYLCIFLFGKYLLPILQFGISSYSDKYEFYQNAGVVNSGLGLLYYSVLFGFVLYYERMQNRKISSIFKIAILSFLLMPFALIIDMTGRIGMYFSISTIIVYPVIANSIKNPLIRYSFLTNIVLLTLYQYFQFIYSDMYSPYFYYYQSIFSAPSLF